MILRDYLLQRYIFLDCDNQKNYPKKHYPYVVTVKNTKVSLLKKLLKDLCQDLFLGVIFSSFYELKRSLIK